MQASYITGHIYNFPFKIKGEKRSCQLSNGSKNDPRRITEKCPLLATLRILNYNTAFLTVIFSYKNRNSERLANRIEVFLRFSKYWCPTNRTRFLFV